MGKSSDYFRSFSQNDLVELIQSVRRCLYISLPSLHGELVTSLKHLSYSTDKNEKEVDPIYVKLKTKPEVLHAETNAIAKVARSGESSEGSSLYVTMAPCMDCAKLIHQSGISRVFYNNTYHKGDAGISFLEKCGIEVIHVPDR